MCLRDDDISFVALFSRTAQTRSSLTWNSKSCPTMAALPLRASTDSESTGISKVGPSSRNEGEGYNGVGQTLDVSKESGQSLNS